MKIDKYLLTEQDIKNIELKANIDNEINKQLKIKYGDLINEQSEKYKINYNDLDTSENNRYVLKREYNKQDNIFSCLFFGFISIAGITNAILSSIYCGFVIQNVWILVAWGIISVALIYLGIKGILIKRKIKKNLKEVGLKL